ncbi:MAG: uracil phosphoribosyltransferase [Flavobacteriales bacterium]
MIIHDFSKNNSVLNHFVVELRDIAVQKDSMRFRRNLERIGEVLAYELSKTLDYEKVVIQTPLAKKESQLLQNQPVICTILRAGLPLHLGMLNYFDQSETTFVSAFRTHPEEGKEFEIVVEYLATPDLHDKTLIIADPMLATGESMVSVYNVLKKQGIPKEIHVVAAIGSEDGVNYISKYFPENTHLWIAAIDPVLNDKKYIVPGLGDAGDLAFGKKL